MAKKITKKKQVTSTLTSVKEYASVLLEIKRQVMSAQTEAISAVNFVLNKRNWFIGKIIFDKQAAWGTYFIEQLAMDLQKSLSRKFRIF